MANTFLALPAPAGNASGAAVDVSAMGATKTIVVEGNGSGLFEPYVQIEVSNDDAHLIWSPLYRFLKPGSITIAVSCRFMRATVQNYSQGGAPTVNVGGEDVGTDFAELVAPAGNGFGAEVDVSALPPLQSYQVSGTFKGNCSIQISNDDGVTWAQADGLAFKNKGGFVTLVMIAQKMRIARSGIQAREPNPGLPVIDIGASVQSGSGGSATVHTDGITVFGDGSTGDPITLEPMIEVLDVTDTAAPVVISPDVVSSIVNVTTTDNPNPLDATLDVGPVDGYRKRITIYTNEPGTLTFTGDASPISIPQATADTPAIINLVWAEDAAKWVLDGALLNCTSASEITYPQGSLIGVQRLAGVGTYTPTPGTKKVWLRMCGGGGGGGQAAATTAGNATAGGGGGSGSWLERYFVNPAGIAGGAYSVGAGGAPSADGGDTTLTIESTALTCGGGANGSNSADGQTFTNAAAGGAGGATANTGGTSGFHSAGNTGLGGVCLAENFAWGGAGGSCPFGSGGRQAQATAGAPGITGFDASANAFGGGGGGGANATAPLGARAGGSGRPGTIIIYEYA